jgi:PEP-CTERM motif
MVHHFQRASALMTLFSGLLCGTATAATLSIPVGGQTVSPFGGFDWAQNGAAWVDDYDLVLSSATGATDTFAIYYQANAVSVDLVDGSAASISGLNSGYEFTVTARAFLQGTCIAFLADSCGFVSLSIQPGSGYDIKYDDSVDASQLTGTGFTDGTTIISGDITGVLPANVQTDVFGFLSAGNPLAVSLFGNVSFTNPAFIAPDLDTTTVTSTFQLNASGTNFTRPPNFDGVGAPPATNSSDSFVVQADANQRFTERRVPEPETYLLMGLGLLALGAVLRRKA